MERRNSNARTILAYCFELTFILPRVHNELKPVPEASNSKDTVRREIRRWTNFSEVTFDVD